MANPFNFRPLGDRVFVERLEAEDQTKGGIIIPDTAKKKPMKGRVLSVGPGSYSDDGKLRPLEIKVGDIIFFTKWAGTEIETDYAETSSREFLVVKESDVLGILDA